MVDMNKLLGSFLGSGAAPAETPVVNVAALKAPPAGSAFLPTADDQAANDRLGLMLIRAMIAARLQLPPQLVTELDNQVLALKM